VVINGSADDCYKHASTKISIPNNRREDSPGPRHETPTISPIQQATNPWILRISAAVPFFAPQTRLFGFNIWNKVRYAQGRLILWHRVTGNTS
jgi:hypothetical protein